MKRHNRLELLVVAAAVLLSSMSVSYAERAGKPTQEEQMQQMMDMIKGMSKGAGQGKGMDEKTQKQLENMFKGMGQQMDKRQAVQTKKEQQQFEAGTVGHGKATVEVEGKRYELTMTQCELWGSESRGRFQIAARQAPAMGDKKLSFGADKNKSIGLTFESDEFKRGRYWREGSGPRDVSTSLTIDDNIITWNGMIGEMENIPATIHVTCGAEMVNYSKPSKPRPKTPAKILTLYLGDETHTFQAGYCSTKEYRTGNLMVEVDATATGTFRGRPAIIFLNRSHPVSDKPGHFEEMELVLGELSPEQRTLPPWKASQELRGKVNAFSTQVNGVIQEKYQKKLEPIQKKFNQKDLPQDKMMALLEEQNKIMDAQGKEMDKVRDQTKAMRFPMAHGHGTVTVKGQEVLYRGPKLYTQDADRAPEFKNLEDIPEVWLTCGR